MRIPWPNSAQKIVKSSDKTTLSLDNLDSTDKYTTKLSIGLNENISKQEINDSNTSNLKQKSSPTSNRMCLNEYQISPELSGRLVQLLENKYGCNGQVNVHLNATKIQRWYRNCKLKQHFERLTQREDGEINKQVESLNCVIRRNSGENCDSQPILRYHPPTSLSSQLRAERLKKNNSINTNNLTEEKIKERRSSILNMVSPRLCKRWTNCNNTPKMNSIQCSSTTVFPATTTAFFQKQQPQAIVHFHESNTDVYSTKNQKLLPNGSLRYKMRVPWSNSSQKSVKSSSNKTTSSLDNFDSVSDNNFTTKLTIGDDSNSKTSLTKSEQKQYSPSSSIIRSNDYQISSPILNGRLIQNKQPQHVGVFVNRSWSNSNGRDLSSSKKQHMLLEQPSIGGGSENSSSSNTTEMLLHTEWSEQQRRRLYRIALNFFNKKPDLGIQLLIRWGFVEANPSVIARLFRERRGLSKQMIGEYLGTLRSSFHKKVLEHFISDIPMHNMELDIALRQLLKHFRLPGEAQKIDHIIQTFAHCYVSYNSHLSSTNGIDSMYILAFAVVMLNTDLHTPSLKDSRRMKLDEFIKNLCRVEEGKNLDKKMLTGIYERVKEFEFRTDHDHVSQVMKIDQCIISKDKPKLIEPHRRLISHCIVHQIIDPNKRQSSSAHLREIILFNDLMLVCKLIGGRKRSPSSSNQLDQYQLRYYSLLIGLQVQEFQNSLYQNGFTLNFPDGQIMMFNAKNNEDRYCFVTDIRESIAESTEMEQWRINIVYSFDLQCI